MSVAFSVARNVVPGQEDSAESSTGMQKSEVEDSRSARCAWSFCTGQDRELPSSPDEMGNLINLREVQVKYGSQLIDSESDTEEGRQSCDLSGRSRNKVHAASITVTGLLCLAGFATNAVILSMLEAPPAEKRIYLLAHLPLAIGGISLTAIGIKRLVDAYKERSNA